MHEAEERPAIST